MRRVHYFQLTTVLSRNTLQPEGFRDDSDSVWDILDTMQAKQEQQNTINAELAEKLNELMVQYAAIKEENNELRMTNDHVLKITSPLRMADSKIQEPNGTVDKGN